MGINIHSHGVVLWRVAWGARQKVVCHSESMCGPPGGLRGTLNVVEDEGDDWLGSEAVC